MTAAAPWSGPTVTVSGTATECPSVEVRLTCGADVRTATAPVVGGAWTASFANTACACDAAFDVLARCTADASCTASFSGALECEGCPDAIVLPVVGACDSEGNRTVTFDVNVTAPPGSPGFSTQIEWIAGAGVASVASSLASYAVSHAYPTGSSYTARLLFAFPFGCAAIDIPVPFLDPCEAVCPTISRLTVEARAECDASGRRFVHLSASLDGYGDVTYRWVWGDGSPDAIGAATLPSPVDGFHFYTTPGPYTARLEITSPTDCPAIETTVGPLQACDEPPLVITPPVIPSPGADTTDDTETLSCFGLRWIIALLLAGSVFFALLYACPVTRVELYLWVSISLAATALLLSLYWILMCEPGRCEILKLAWEWPLISAVIALYLSGCCSFFHWIALGLAVGAAAAYLLWETQCDIDPCERLVEWSLTLVAGLGGWLGSVLGLVPCGRTIVASIDLILAALVAGYTLATCTGIAGGSDLGSDTPTLPRVTRLRGRRRRKSRCGCK